MARIQGLRGVVRRLRTLAGVLRGAPPRQAPAGRPHLLGLAAPPEEGALDGVVEGVARGWARRSGRPDRPVSVDVYIDGRFIGRVQADRFRPDLAERFGERGMHGFSYALPLLSLGGTELRAYASASGVELAGSPRRLAASPAPTGRTAARRLSRLDFAAPQAVTMAAQRAHHGSRHAVLVETDPGYPDSDWPISRSMAYVDARHFAGRGGAYGPSGFFRLFDAAAERFGSTPCGLPIGHDLLARFTSDTPAPAKAPTRLLDLIVGTADQAYDGPLSPADYAGLGLDYLYQRRLPIDLLGDRLMRRLVDPAELLVALRRLSAFRDVAGSDEALMKAAEAVGILAALKGEAGAQTGAVPVSPGVLVLSADYGGTGLSNNVRRSLDALERLGIEHAHASVKMAALPTDLSTIEPVRKTILIHAQPPDATEIMLRLNAAQSQGRVIGFFMWETETAPAEFDLGIRLVDEIWTGSRYSADAFIARHPSAKVRVVGHAVEPVAPDATFDARAFAGAGPDDFLFYTHFDAASWITRKNPVAAVRAFRRAFPQGHEACRLLVKTRGDASPTTEAVADAWEELKEAILEDSRIILTNADLPRSAMATLMQAADCYVSLHRAEGFGYGPAEAMLAGVPLIVSAYSGSLDFTQAAWLTPCRRRPILPGEFLAEGAGQHWGEPDVDVAAAHMREIFQDPQSARDRAAAAGAQVAEQLSPASLASGYGVNLEGV